MFSNAPYLLYFIFHVWFLKYKLSFVLHLKRFLPTKNNNLKVKTYYLFYQKIFILTEFVSFYRIRSFSLYSNYVRERNGLFFYSDDNVTAVSKYNRLFKSRLCVVPNVYGILFNLLDALFQILEWTVDPVCRISEYKNFGG